MIGNLARRSEQIENEAVQWTDLRTRRTRARLAFADHMHRFSWLARTRRLMAR